MGGPWEDFQPQPEHGPWEDFQAPSAEHPVSYGGKLAEPGILGKIGAKLSNQTVPEPPFKPDTTDVVRPAISAGLSAAQDRLSKLSGTVPEPPFKAEPDTITPALKKGVRETASFAGGMAKRALPFPGLINAITDPNAPERQDMGALLNPMPQALTDAFKAGGEAIGKYVSPEAAKLAEDAMIMAPFFPPGMTSAGLQGVRNLRLYGRGYGVEGMPEGEVAARARDVTPEAPAGLPHPGVMPTEEATVAESRGLPQPKRETVQPRVPAESTGPIALGEPPKPPTVSTMLSTRLPPGGRQQVEALADKHVDTITDTPAQLEYQGHTYEGAVREGARKVRLKDNPDKVIAKAEDILSVEEKIPFDVPPMDAATEIDALQKEQSTIAKQMLSSTDTALEDRMAEIDQRLRDLQKPMVEQTPAGAQAVIPGAEPRTVPTTGLQPKKAQTDKPLELEQPGIAAKEPELFTEPPVLTSERITEKIAQASEGQPTFNQEKIANQVEKAGETYVKTEVDPNALTIRESAAKESEKAAPEKGAIVVDDQGNVIDGNHRAAQAKEQGETVEAYVPATSPPSEPQELQALIAKWQQYQKLAADPKTKPNRAVQFASAGKSVEEQIRQTFGGDAVTEMIRQWLEEKGRPKTQQEILEQAIAEQKPAETQPTLRIEGTQATGFKVVNDSGKTAFTAGFNRELAEQYIREHSGPIDTAAATSQIGGEVPANEKPRQQIESQTGVDVREPAPTGTTAPPIQPANLPPRGQEPTGTENGGQTQGAGGDVGGRGVRRGDERDTGAAGRPSDGGQPSGTAPAEGAGGSVPEPPGATQPVNHVLPRDHDWIPSGEKTKVRTNLSAIRILKDIESQGRLATPEEKAVLAQYVGWGGIPQVFDEGKAAYRQFTPYSEEQKKEAANWEKNWGKLYDEVHESLDAEEYARARRSMLNAHYTSREIINGMWDAVQRLGFHGGRALEPATGVGHFIGLQPQNLRVAWRGTELDSISARIAQQLYPAADIQQTGFQDAKIPVNSQDLVISNVPFDAEGPVDKRYPERYSLHNYFIIRSLDLAKPGGIVAVITSDSTMDNPGASRKARDAINERADLVGAVRLPNTAFKGNANTEVTTDILFLRKRDGTAFKGQDWARVVPAETYKGEPIEINEYYANHPEMMLGRMSLEGTMRRAGQQALIPNHGANLPDEIKAAIDKLPADVMGSHAPADTTEPAPAEKIIAKSGALVLDKAGKPVIVGDDGTVEAPSWTNSPSKVDQAKRYIAVRDQAIQLIRRQLDPNAADAEIATEQKILNNVYDGYFKKYGAINDRVASFLREDTDYPLAAALEDAHTAIVERQRDGKTYALRETTYSKGLMFTERTLFPREAPDSADTVADGLQVAINFRGKVDPDYIAQLTKKPVDAVKRELVDQGLAFDNPKTGQWESRYEYLSGFVKEKLGEARTAAQDDPAFQRHVAELEKVQPAPIPMDGIGVRLGAKWVPESVIKRFVDDTLGINSTVSFTPQTGDWHVSARSYSERNSTTFGIHGFDGHKLVEKSLNLKNAQVVDIERDSEGKPREKVNKEKSLEAQQKQQTLQDAFQKYVLEKPDIAEQLAQIYNDKFNGVVIPKAEAPSWTHYPNAAANITLRDHQKAVVSRILQNSTLLAHAVGTGKTYIMITAAMEMRRLGLAKKPMIVVQNATLEQFARSAKRLYPGARILAPDAKARDALNRNRTMSRITTGDWDMVIVPQSFVNMLPDNPKRVSQYVQDQIDQLKNAAIEARLAEGKNSPKAKDIEKMVERLEARLDELLKRKVDNVLTFEQLGVDALFVDEAHAYKKLQFVTKMDNIKGLDKGASQRGLSMLMKTRWVQEQNQGKNVVFATGTPVSNTLAEAWNMMRYIRPDVLKKYDMEDFDSFATLFTRDRTAQEMNAAGGWKFVKRLDRFANGPELIAAWRTVADVITAAEVNLPDLPAIKGGAPQEIALEQGPDLQGYMKHLKEELERFEQMSGKQKRDNSHIPLVVFGNAKKATLDMRMIDPTLPDQPGSKLNRAADEIARIYKEATPVKGTQLVFADSFRDNPDDPQFNLHEELKKKLVRRGIPEKEIVVITDKIKDAKRELVFERVNAGDIRVAIGSTERMGIGVNAQERMIGLHHLDAPPRPMDIEQRNGRIVRQGNMNPLVEILNYGVKGTLDGVMYQKLAAKQKFTNQIIKGDITGRNFEDPTSEESLTFEEMMAAFSGDVRAVKKIGLEHTVRELESLKKGHADEMIKAQRSINDARTRWIPLIQKNLVKSDALAVQFDKAFPKGAPLGVSILGRQYADRKEAGAALTEYFDKLIQTTEKTARDNNVFGTIESADIHDLSLNGMPITANVKIPSSDLKGVRDVEKATVNWKFTGTDARAGEVTTGQGFFRGVEGQLEAIGREPMRQRENLATQERNLRELESFVKTPFGKDAELEAARQQLNGLMAELEAEGKAGNTDIEDVPPDEPTDDIGGGGTAGFPEFSKTTPDIPQSQAPLNREYAAPGQTSKIPIYRRGDIIRNLQERLQVPIRSGHANFNQMKAAGFFKIEEEVIRLKKANDMEVAAHEVGHYISKQFLKYQYSGQNARRTPFTRELIKMGKDLYGDRKPNGGYAEEGIAQFVRFYVTDPERALREAPLFSQFFDELLDKEFPDLKDALAEARDDWRKYKEQPAVARVLSQVSVGEGEPRRFSLSQIYQKAIDDLHYIKVFEDRMTKGQEPLQPSDSPYTLARLFRGWLGRAEMFLKDGPIDFDTLQPVAGVKALNKILGPFDEKGLLDDLRAYLVARRAAELMNRGIETGLKGSDVHEVLDTYNSRAEFVQAAEEIYAYNDALVDYLQKAGIVSESGAQIIREQNQNYVPFYRLVDLSDAPGSGSGSKFANVGNPVKKIKGSTREIIDPLEGTIKNTYAMINVADRNLVAQKIIELAENAEGMGKYVEEVPRAKIPLILTGEEIADMLAKLGIEEKADIPEEMVAAFRPMPQVPGIDHILAVKFKGKPRWFQVHPDLYEAMAGLERPQHNLLITALSLPANALRLGATALSPEFSIRNPARDALSAALFSKTGFIPIPGGHFAAGIFAMLKRPELYDAWKAGGGEGSMMVSLDRKNLQKTLKEVVDSGKLRGIMHTVIQHPIDALRAISAFNETVTRLGEFKRIVDAKGEGLTRDAIIEGAYGSREVTLDFARMGATIKSTGLNRIIAFFNANIQDIDKLAREFKARPQLMFARAMALLAIPSLLLWLINRDDPRYEELPAFQKDLFWVFPTGSMDRATWAQMTDQQKAEYNSAHWIFRYPKPFWPGLLFGTAPERILDWTAKNDPQALTEFLKTASGQVPDPLPWSWTAVQPVVENMMNYSQFRGRPLVSRSRQDLEPWAQYGPNTSQTAKMLGKLVNYSPAKIENLVRGWFGFPGQLGFDVGDLALPSKIKGAQPEKTLADIPVARAFAVRSPSQPESIESFYKAYTDGVEAKNTWDAIKKERKPEEARKYFEDNRQRIADAAALAPAAKALSSLRSRMDVTTQNEKLSPEAKRKELDAITFRMIDIAKRAIGDRQTAHKSAVNQ